MYQASTETGHEASLVMSTRASGTRRDSTEADPAASLGMTVVSKITSAHQASTETSRGASSAISTSAISEEPRGEPAMVETFPHGSAPILPVPRSTRQVLRDGVGHLSGGDRASHFDIL